MTDLRKENFSIQLLQIIDAVLVFLSFYLSLWLWNTFGHVITGEVVLNELGLGQISSALYISIPFIPLCLELFGFYRHFGRQSPVRGFVRVLQANLLVLVAFSLLAVGLKFTPHRPTLIVGYVMSTLVLWMRELAANRTYQRKISQGVGRMRVILAGVETATSEWWENLEQQEKGKYEIVGKYAVNTGQKAELRKLLENTAAERVVFLVQDCPFDLVTQAVEECEIQGVEVWLAADFVRARICQPTFDQLGGTPMLVLRSTPSLSWSLLAKDVMDRGLAGLGILLSSPIWLVIAIGIKMSDPGPVFFRQERAGRYGKAFRMWKFRTMVVDAEARLAELKREAGNEMSGPVFKLDHDPRIFKLGVYLRKFSLDELPQLINVFTGEMSLVGPRPMAMYELPEIEKSEHRRKLSVKPGITCIWQVEGRNTITDFDDWVKLDLQYIDNWSIWLDIRLLIKTIPAVLFAKGAK